MENEKNGSKELAKVSSGKKIVNPSDPNAIFSPDGLEKMLSVCNHFLASNALPSSYKNPSQVLLAIQAGRELGMKPMESLNGLMLINGQLKLWGTALSGRLTSMGYTIEWTESDNKKATVIIISPDGKETKPETYTIEDATQAGLTNKQNWRGHTRTMLRWRAISNAIKFNFPHLLQSITMVEDDDNIDYIEEESPKGKTQGTDNASKLLNKGKEKSDINKTASEVVAREEKKEPSKVIDVEPEKEEPKITAEEGVKIIQKIVEVGSKRKEVEKYFKKDIYDFTKTDAVGLLKILKEKEDESNSAEEKPPQSTIAKKMEAGKEKVIEENKIKKDKEEGKLTDGIPGDVCQYLNSISAIDKTILPTDILLLLVDTNKGQFRGYDAYSSLRDKIKQAQGATQTKEKIVEPMQLTPEILEISNELASHDPDEFNEDQKNFIIDVNANKFKGKEFYKGVKF